MGHGLFIRLSSPSLGHAVLLEVEAAEPVSGSGLAAALARHWPGQHWFSGTVALESMARLPLQGRLLLGDAPMGEGSGSQTVNGVDPAVLVVLRGPDPGGRLPLHRGVWALGRGDVDLPIGDLLLSRRHALVRVDGTSIVLSDEGSANGLWFARTPIVHRRLLIGDIFGAGESLLGVLPPAGLGTGHSRWPWDKLPIDAPEPGSRLAMMLVGALAPLGLGVGLFLLTHSVFFLAFCALSVLTGGLPAVAALRARKVFRRAWVRATVADMKRRADGAPPVGAVAAGLAASVGVDPAGLPPMVVGHGRLAAWLCTTSGAEPPEVKPRRVSGSALRAGAGRRSNVKIAEGEATAPGMPADAATPPEPGIIADSPVALSLGDGSTVWFPGPAQVWGPVLRAVLVRWLPLLNQGSLRVVVVGPAGFLPAEFAMLRGVLVLEGGQQIPADGAPTIVMVLRTGERGALRRPEQAAGPAGATTWLCCGGPEPAQPAGIRVDCSNHRVLLEPSGCRENPWLLRVPAVVDAATAGAARRARRTAPHQESSGSGPRERGRGADAGQGAGSSTATTLKVEPEGISLQVLARAIQRILESTAQTATSVLGAPDDDEQASAAAASGSTFPAALALVGDTEAGPLRVDLDADGPHFLVAGTTGSGKSELLRSWVLGLGLGLGPDELAFMLVDFKGGATLAPLAPMPHVQLFVSDLDAAAGERLLELLGHELRRRETFLARHAATDHRDYLRSRSPEDPPLPRLVVVIDEFRVFASELPDALERVIHIATVGRSLGIHLVLSTQRPAGTVSAPLRANIGSVIALRTIGESESNDLIGSPLAAGLDPGLPGIAYFRHGGAAPVKFRARVNARPSIPALLRARGGTLAQVLFTELLTDEGGAAGRDPAEPGSDAELASQVQRVIGRHQKIEPAGNPFSAALPAQLPGIGRSVARQLPAGRGIVGLLDRVQLSSASALVFDPRATPRLLACGLPSSGIERIPELLLHAISRGSFTMPAFLLDGNGTQSRLRGHPVLRGYFGPGDTWRINELLLQLGDPRITDPVLLIVCGLGGWAQSLEAGTLMRLEAMLTVFARTAAEAGRALVICGDRELAGSRAASLCETRWYFPRGAGPELLMGWPRLRRIASHAGRGVLLGPDEPERGTEFQLLDDAARLPLPAGPAPDHWLRSVPLPGVLLPADLDAADSHLLLADSIEGGLAPGLRVGVCGPDNREFIWSPGPCGIVLGHEGAGKGALLAHLAVLTGSAPGHTVYLRLHDELPVQAENFLELHPGVARVLVERADVRVARASRAVEILLGAGLQVVLSAEPGPRLLFELGLTAAVRDQRSFLVLDPQFGADSDPSGLRFPPAGESVPGRALVLDRGTLRQIQCVDGFAS